MNLAGYVRVSTEGQVDAFGKDVQRSTILRWAELNGHEIVDWFEEDGVSGKTDGGDRPQLSALLTRASEFDGVVALDATRFARRSVVQETLLGLVWSAGLRVFTTTAGELSDDDDPTRILIRQILAVISEFDHRSIVKRLLGGRLAKSAQGGYIGGTPPYGMRVEGTGRGAALVPDPEEVGVINEILAQRRAKLPYRQIAESLNNRQIPTKMGCAWAPGQVARIVKRYAE